MKKITITCIILLSAVMILTAQPPQAMKYKAIAKNDWGIPLPNRNISLRFTIYQGSENGTPVYCEVHQTRTNLFGLMDVNIGQGTTLLGTFAGIDWGADNFFIKTELDPKGGNDFRIEDASHQLLSVPYALYAGGVLNNADNDADPTNEIQDISLSGTDLSISEGSTIDLGLLRDGYEPDTDDQTLFIYGHQLSISEGNTVMLPDDIDDADADPTNEIQNISIEDHSLSISGGSTITLPDETDDADANPANEIQDLQLTGNILTITNNTSATPIDLSAFDTRLTETEVDAMVGNNGYLTAEADGDVTNEIQDLSIDGHILSITDGSTIQIPDSVNDADHDPVNEIQELSLKFNMLFLSTNGRPDQIDLSPYLDNTDEQFLSIDGHQLTIFNGNTIQLPDSVNDADHDPSNEIQDLIGVLLHGTDAGKRNITNLSDPVNDQDAATKSYVDALKTQISVMNDILLNAGYHGSIMDVEDIVYKTIKIGNQVWMAENLKTTKYDDGTDIPLVTDNTEWGNLTIPGYCWFDNDQTAYGYIYGALYNWYTINTDNLCPTDWHVPTDAEWTTLIDYLTANGHSGTEGTALKATTGWISGGKGTDDYGFTALPSGIRGFTGSFDGYEIGEDCGWWSATDGAYYRYIGYDTRVIRGDDDKRIGFSVRCVRDY